MWLDFYWRWRYLRIRQKIPDLREDPVGAIRCLHSLFHRLTIEEHTYRQRVQQRISTKTPTVTQLIQTLHRVNQLVEIRSHYTDALFARYHTRQLRQLDSWLMDDDQYPVDEPDAHRIIDTHVGQLLSRLDAIRLDKETLYEYYNHNLSYVLTDAFYAMDALMALQLNVDPDSRIGALPLTA